MNTLAVHLRSGAAALMIMCATLSSGSAQTTQPAAEPRTPMAHWETLKWDTSQQGREIDLSQYRRTFNDDFKKMSIVKDDAAPGPDAVWFSPGHGAFKTNSPLRKDGPFSLVDEGLRVRVDKIGDRWYGACMQTVNTKGEGFAQQYGYFEMEAEYKYPMPGGDRIWGAFWLKSQKDYFTGGTTTRTEIDINEFYADDGYHATVHLWPAAKLSPDATITKHVMYSGYKQKIGPTVFKPLKENGVVKGFHTYGGEITPEWVIMYFDRKELARFPMVDEWKTPLYMLVDLIVTKPEDQAVFPMDMIVRNISAYLPNKPYEEKQP